MPTPVMVAPYTGAWIETNQSAGALMPSLRSLPTRERGLKQRQSWSTSFNALVAPYTGAWIETCAGGGT